MEVKEELVTEKEFQQMLERLRESSGVVRQLLKHYGSYEQMPDHVKDVLDRELGVRRKTVHLRMVVKTKG